MIGPKERSDFESRDALTGPCAQVRQYIKVGNGDIILYHSGLLA